MKETFQERVSKKTNLYPVTNKFINDEWEKLRRDQIIPWNFLNSGNMPRCQDFYGKVIQYQGVLFEGSPRIVFWGRYIEPFLEDICFRSIDQTITICYEKGERIIEPLWETAYLLKILVRKTYNLMADVDQRLRGRGYPQSVPKRCVEGEIGVMDIFIDERIKSEIAMYKTPSKLIKFYNEHESLIKIVAIIVAVISIVLGILRLFTG